MSMRRTTCAYCRRKLEPGEYIHESCKAPYAEACGAKAERKAAKAIKTAAKEDRAETKRRKEKLKTRSDYLKEAQRAFNAFVRERDRAAGYPCISSGRTLDWSGNKTDAGHWRSTGAAPNLRFNEDNCHAQSKHDNQYLAGNAVEYRVRLIERIGLERVEALECDNAPRRFTGDELIEIRDHYRSKARELKNQQDH